jgi:hypothetical protein
MLLSVLPWANRLKSRFSRGVSSISKRLLICDAYQSKPGLILNILAPMMISEKAHSADADRFDRVIAVTAQLVGLCSMDWSDYLRDQAAKYRQLAEQTDDPVIKNELLELAEADPPGPAKETSWLPVAKAPFTLMKRLYAPKDEVLDRTWTPPPITRVPESGTVGRQ